MPVWASDPKTPKGARRGAFCLALLATPAPAQDVFDALTGTFGSAMPEESCAMNPKSQSFSAGNTRLCMEWAAPVPSYMDEGTIRFLEGDVLSSDDRSVTYRRDGETRLDARGQPLRWTLRLEPGAGGFCVTRPDVPRPSCITLFLPCGLEGSV